MAASMEHIPLTIRSRCHTLFFAPVATAELTTALHARGIDQDSSMLLAHISRGLPGLALHFREFSDDLALMVKRIESFLHVAGASLNEQLAFTQTLVKPGESGPEARDRVLLLLEDWERALRDTLALSVGADSVITLPTLHPALTRLAERLDPHTLVATLGSVDMARRAIGSNVHPRFVIEHFFTSISP